jgi:hypothetical protein
MGLQPISFNHSDIPPRGAAAILERARRSVCPADYRQLLIAASYDSRELSSR